MDTLDLQPFVSALLLDFARWIPMLLAALTISIVGWLVSRLTERTVARILQRSGLVATHQHFFSVIARWVVLAITAAAALNAVGLGGLATGLMAGGGATAVVLGFAFREIDENLLAGVLLAFSRPFKLGDTVASGDVEGKVVELDLRTIHVRTEDGRDIWIPNSQIINQPFTNFTLDGMRRPSFEVGIDYGDDASRACGLILDAIKAVPDVLGEPGAKVVIQSLDGSWVVLKASFWADADRAKRSISLVRSDALDATRKVLREAGYTLSCDTTTAVSLHPSSDVAVRMAG